MKRKAFLERKIASYLRKGQLLKEDEHKKLEKAFLAKARKNYAVANLMLKISEQDDVKKALALPESFETHEWVITISYYGMHMSALAAIAKLGFKSKSHAATIALLECHYVREERLEARQVDNLSKAYLLSKELITKLVENKMRRETAQYDATPAISRETAKASLEDADEFITKIDEALEKAIKEDVEWRIKKP